MNPGKFLKIILIVIILIITFGGFLWNCTFTMDTTKYPDRLTCTVDQYANIIGKRLQKVGGKAQDILNQIPNILSGSTNNP